MSDDAGIVVSGTNIERDLKRIADDIGPAINDAIRNNASDLERVARERALTIQLRGGKRGARDTGLRRAIAAAVGVQYENEKVVFIVSRDRMPDGKESLPLLSVSRSWRHPVYGNRNNWVAQMGQVAWFQKAIRAEADKVIPKDIIRSIERLAR